MKNSGWSDQLRERIAASELGQRLWTRYEAATPGEQTTVKIVGILLVLFLLVSGVLAPLHRYHGDARANYQQQLETLAWMQANRGLVGAAPTLKPRQANESLLSVANQGAHNAGLSFQRSESSGENTLNVWLEKAPFNQVVAWLGQLEREYGIVASELAVTRRNEPGLVDVRVTLQD